MTHVGFGDKDRQRWDLPEWVPWHINDIAVADLTDLSERFDFDVADWPEVFWGEIPFEQAGQPDAKRVRPKWWAQAMVWMTLRQNDHPATWDEAGQVRVGWLRMRAEEPDVTGGKDEAPPKPSEPSEPSTTAPSETS